MNHRLSRSLQLVAVVVILLVSSVFSSSAMASEHLRFSGAAEGKQSASARCSLLFAEVAPSKPTNRFGYVYDGRVSLRHTHSSGTTAAPGTAGCSSTPSRLSAVAGYDAPVLLRVSQTGMATKAAGAVCSFGGETRVLMADGTTKPISQVEAGDMVLAQDPETGEIGARRVTDAWVHDDDLVRLEIDGDVVRTTEDHPFWNDTDKQWQRADQLDAGDLVLTAEGRRVKVGVLIGSAGRGSAFNFTVEGLHTYHVLFGDDAVLVHNACPLVDLADNITPQVLDHVFVPKHNLGPLVSQFGSKEAVIGQMLNGVRGSVPVSGKFVSTIQLGGQTVVVRGAVVNGVIRIGTAFTP